MFLGVLQMNYFTNCQSVEEAKKRYRELLMQHHPDHAGQEGEAITKEIILQFNAFLKNFVSQSFYSYYQDKDWKPDPSAETPFQDILQKIINFDCEIEIIGYWIYCFNSKSVKDQLKELGFWFTGKHKAWVYSGRAKRNIGNKETIDELRARKGSQKVEKEEKEKKNHQFKIAV
jgi:curved DNA-binding protein CbpA